jgi:hypothetical protein
VVGRKNWLFADTVSGAHSSALFYTLIEGAKAAGLNPALYMSHLLQKAPYAISENDWRALLPVNLKDRDWSIIGQRRIRERLQSNRIINLLCFHFGIFRRLLLSQQYSGLRVSDEMVRVWTFHIDMTYSSAYSTNSQRRTPRIDDTCDIRNVRSRREAIHEERKLAIARKTRAEQNPNVRLLTLPT